MHRIAIVSAALALALQAGTVDARIKPADMVPLVGVNYAPVDKDEKGLWDSLERAEEEIASSPTRVKDPALNAYVNQVLERISPPGIHPRLYIVRTAVPNAGMYPNGMMLVHSGMFTRLRNEAQLAALLGHEIGHYLRQHTLRQWRDTRRRAAISSFISVGLGIGGVATRTYTGDLVQSINNALVLGMFAYSRELEAEADAMSVGLLRNAGYDPGQASEIWRQMIGERDASAKARGKKPKQEFSVFATHPADELRMSDLALSAKEVETGGESFQPRFVAAFASARPWLLDDQVKLNDPGASLYLLDAQAKDGWDGLLKFEQAEVYRLRGAPGDIERASAGLAQAVTLPGAPPEAFRAQGYALIKAGRAPEGKIALERYLTLAPAAKDATMVRYAIAH